MKVLFGDYFREKRMLKGGAKVAHTVQMKVILFQPLKRVVRITIIDGDRRLSICIRKENLEIANDETKL